MTSDGDDGFATDTQSIGTSFSEPEKKKKKHLETKFEHSNELAVLLIHKLRAPADFIGYKVDPWHLNRHLQNI